MIGLTKLEIAKKKLTCQIVNLNHCMDIDKWITDGINYVLGYFNMLLTHYN